jgi:hypothetical protein
LCPIHSSEAGRGEDGDGAAGDGEDEERFRSHGVSFEKSFQVPDRNDDER